MPVLERHGISLDSLRAGMRAGTGSQPMTIPDATATAIVEALNLAPITLHGPELRAIRQRTSDLESPGDPLESESVNLDQQASRHRTRCGC